MAPLNAGLQAAQAATRRVLQEFLAQGREVSAHCRQSYHWACYGQVGHARTERQVCGCRCHRRKLHTMPRGSVAS